MNEPAEPLQPETVESHRISMVWIVPIVAILLGGWMVYRHIQSQGPLIEVTFGTADGIEEGKTELRSRSVKIGLVESVELTSDLQAVRVEIRVDPDAEGLIREDSRFWVVRPRVSGANVSGLGTILSGAFIELDPGAGEDGAREFVGLDEPPVTPSNVPGLRLTLFAPRPVQADVGSPVFFEGNEVGKIERRRFDPVTRDLELRAFIYEEFADLVTDGVLFWSDNGVEVTAGPEGFKFDLPSLEALVAGGVTFGQAPGLDAGEPVEDGSTFMLFENEQKALEQVYAHGGEFLLLFDQSVRGLSEGARVEFRGLPVGRVGDISFVHAPEGETRRVPVRVVLNETLLAEHLPPSMQGEGLEGLKRAVTQGLRASLRTSSLLTGQLFVDLDFYDEASPAEIVMLDGHEVLPTVETGLGRLEDQLGRVLAKLEALPVEESLASINKAVEQSARTLEAAEKAFGSTESALVEARDTLNAVRELLENPEFEQLPGEVRETLVALRGSLEGVGPESSVYGDLRRTLDELRGAARSIERVAETIEEKPNSLVFGKGLKREIIPKAVPAR